MPVEFQPVSRKLFQAVEGKGVNYIIKIVAFIGALFYVMVVIKDESIIFADKYRILRQ